MQVLPRSRRPHWWSPPAAARRRLDAARRRRATARRRSRRFRDQTRRPGHRAESIDFAVDDRESGAGSLMVSAAADGTGLFPADGVVLVRQRRDAHADADAARGDHRYGDHRHPRRRSAGRVHHAHLQGRGECEERVDARPWRSTPSPRAKPMRRPRSTAGPSSRTRTIRQSFAALIPAERSDEGAGTHVSCWRSCGGASRRRPRRRPSASCRPIRISWSRMCDRRRRTPNCAGSSRAGAPTRRDAASVALAARLPRARALPARTHVRRARRGGAGRGGRAARSIRPQPATAVCRNACSTGTSSTPPKRCSIGARCRSPPTPRARRSAPRCAWCAVTSPARAPTVRSCWPAAAPSRPWRSPAWQRAWRLRADCAQARALLAAYPAPAAAVPRRAPTFSRCAPSSFERARGPRPRASPTTSAALALAPR